MHLNRDPEAIMRRDEAIEEIWAVRLKISEEHGHNTKAMLDYYRWREKKYPATCFVSRSSAKRRQKTG